MKLLTALLTSLVLSLFVLDNDALAAGPDIYLGKHKSSTTVYFISDWFCPGCRKSEPVVEEVFQDVASKARVAFIDYPIHPETTNYSPYNLQLQINEKLKYMQLRHALGELSRQNKKPTDEQVQAALKPLGVSLRPHNFVELAAGLKLYQSIIKEFVVDTTPTIVVDNPKTGKRKLLVGTKAITAAAIREAVQAVGK